MLYNTDDLVTLTAQESTGYVFINWSGDTAGIPDVSQAAVSVKMNANRMIAANFVPATTTYTVTTGSTPGGSITLQPAQSDYPVNQGISVSAVPNAGCFFDHWTGDLSGTSPTATMNINGNKSISAVFNTTLTIQQTGVGGGTVEAIPSSISGRYAAGTVVSLTARPSLGYLFDGWTGDVFDIPDVGKATVTVVTDAGRALTANFVSSPPLKVTAAVQYEGSGSITLEPVEPSEGYPASREIKVYALAKVGYAFSHWTGNANGTSPILTLSVDGEKRIVAVFDPKVTVWCDPVEGGGVEVTSPRSSGGYATGTEITIEAIAGKGYRFKSWSGGLSGPDNPTSIRVDSPKTLTALFVKESGFPWWWIIIGIVVLFSGLIALRLVYVVVGRRSEAA
jgi:hypothetical protein